MEFMAKSFFANTGTFENSDIVIFGAPFDGTTTFRPGARFAPSTMRQESYGLESYSPYFDMDTEDYNYYDAGDIDLPFGSTEKALEDIRQMSERIFSAGKKPLMIGGEHLVTLPAVKEAYKAYPELHIIHFDAHTDLREEYLGERLSHSTVLKRIWDFIGDGKIYQFGIRSGTREEFYWAKEHTKLCKNNLYDLDNAICEIGDRPVYFTLDLDVLDPSVMSGTGTTEAGGISFTELINAFISMSELNIVGADIVELSPHYDHSGASTAAACKALREMLLMMSK